MATAKKPIECQKTKSVSISAVAIPCMHLNFHFSDIKYQM
uniref:Uncharacterized protein n=1 Tax=Arundo donax TaxID=35708 RepID=A0A0A9G742_ARUDO